MFVDIRKNPQVAKDHDRAIHRIDYTRAELADQYRRALHNAGDMGRVKYLLGLWERELDSMKPLTPVGWLALAWQRLTTR